MTEEEAHRYLQKSSMANGVKYDRDSPDGTFHIGENV